MDEDGHIATAADTEAISKSPEDEAIDVSSYSPDKTPVPADLETQFATGGVRTLDGEIAGDEFARDAVNYGILLGKIEGLLERLRLDA